MSLLKQNHPLFRRQKIEDHLAVSIEPMRADTVTVSLAVAVVGKGNFVKDILGVGGKASMRYS